VILTDPFSKLHPLLLTTRKLSTDSASLPKLGGSKAQTQHIRVFRDECSKNSQQNTEKKKYTLYVLILPFNDMYISQLKAVFTTHALSICEMYCNLEH